MTLAPETFEYRAEQNWGRGTDGRELGVINGVAVDSRDRVYIATRKPAPCVVVFDADGCFLESWGKEIFVKVGGIHGIKIDRDDHLFITDWLDHVVYKFTTEGERLMALDRPSPASRSTVPPWRWRGLQAIYSYRTAMDSLVFTAFPLAGHGFVPGSDPVQIPESLIPRTVFRWTVVIACWLPIGITTACSCSTWKVDSWTSGRHGHLPTSISIKTITSSPGAVFSILTE